MLHAPGSLTPFRDAVATPPKTDYPTPFQRKTLWNAVTALCVVLIGAVGVFLIWVFARVLEFLQPVLVPLAVAGIMAYLLEPLIKRLTARGVKRQRAMLYVFTTFHLTMLFLVLLVVVPAVRSAATWADNKDTSDVIESVRVMGDKAFGWVDRMWSRFSVNEAVARKSPTPDAAAEKDTPDPAITPAPAPAPPTDTADTPATTEDEVAEEGAEPPDRFSSERWLKEHLPGFGKRLQIWTSQALSGFLGLFGYIVGLLLVPIYLYYFLKESEGIKQTWSDYLPLRESKFKSEVVATLTEINGYLIAFFRGQMLVSLIDGALVGLCLTFIGLPGGLLIGVFVALLGLLPYVGSLLCWIPAVLIAVSHFSQTRPVYDPVTHAVVGRHYVNTWAIFPDQIWVYPVIVTLIFVVVQKINSFVTQPRIVGDSVGLHPLTVIFSVIFWSLLIGGFLGVLLAVPLTASLKVLFRRYVWEKRLSARRDEAVV